MDRHVPLPVSVPASYPTPDSDRYEKLSHAELLNRRRLLIAASSVGGIELIASAIPFIESMEPSAKALAEGGPVVAATYARVN
jgi:hypothetical protein